MYCIYKIENMKNHLVYIGLTNNPERRRARHFTDLARGRHCNSFLQKDYQKTGKEHFEFRVIWSGDVDYKGISEKEIEYIEKYDSYYNGYNQNKGGNFGPSNGGSHLLKADILNILSACEFLSRPGTVLGEIFGITNTSVMRIKRGDNHKEVYDEYHMLPPDKRRELFEIFDASYHISSKIAKTHALKTKRKFSEKDIFYFLAQRDYGSEGITKLSQEYKISRYTIATIYQKKPYLDVLEKYYKMPEERRKEYVSLHGDM